MAALGSVRRTLRSRDGRVGVYVAAVIALALASLVHAYLDPLGLGREVEVDLPLVVALVIATAMLERTRTDLFGVSHMSLGIVGVFAAGLLQGPFAAGLCGAVGVVAGGALTRPLVAWYRLAFNAAVMVLTGVAATVMVLALAGAPNPERALWQVAPVAAASLVAYVVNMSLVVRVIALTSGRRMWDVWVEKYRWLTPHYVAFGISAYAMAIGYVAVGAAGVAIFFLPIAMLWFVARQYTARTRADAEELQHANLALARSEERFRSLVQNAPGLTAVLNADGTVQYVNPPAALPPVDVANRSADFVELLVHPDDGPRVHDVLALSISEPSRDHALEVQLRDAGGEWRDYEAVVTNLLANLSVRGIVINARDVTERKQLENRLRHEAFHDPLTNLPNRALFMQELEGALYSAAEGEHRVAVLFLDLDRFKVVNDSLGHNVGDELLISLAGRLKETVGAENVVARFGGDEFVVLLPRVRADEDATTLARRILDSLRDPVKLLGHNTSVTASVGISISSALRRQPRELLRSADVALFQAKELGRGRYVLFDETLDRYSVERLELESELRNAVDNGELRLEYQPEIDLLTGELLGAEALVRWQHPTRGMIPPGDFISLAEETGEIIEIGKWVLRTACAQAAAWKAKLPPSAPFTIAVNLSANEFMETGLVWEVLRTLRETNLDPASLRMEITESVLLHDAPFINEVFLDLKQLGVGLAIDDFGTGYSSLAYLRKLPADVLKVDRSFVADIDVDAREGAVVQAVVRVAEAMGMHVVAEGIERVEQLDYLAEIGCRSGQGFYFSRPVPAETIERMIDEALERTRSAS